VVVRFVDIGGIVGHRHVRSNAHAVKQIINIILQYHSTRGQKRKEIKPLFYGKRATKNIY
jgi:hypothetical protein